MAFQPAVLNPTPDPDFVRQLRRIDPDLRVVFGYERYLMKKWAIERKIEPARYFAIYASLLEADAPRFIDQPIFDSDSPILDEQGEVVGYKQIGTRKFDLAPEYEWVMFADALDARILTGVRRAYAEDRDNSLAQLKATAEAEIASIEKAQKQKRIDAAMDELPKVWHETGKRVMSRPTKERSI